MRVVLCNFISFLLPTNLYLTGVSSVLQSALPMTVELPRRPERPLHTGLSGLEDAVFTIAPMRPQPSRAGPTTNPVEQQRPYNSRAYNTYRTNLNGSFGIEEDPAVVIAAQKQTIERLLEEAGYTSRALEKLKNVEKSEFDFSAVYLLY